MRHVNVVRTYVHLGSVIEANVDLVFDMKRRLKHAQDAARPLAKSVSGTAVCLSRSAPPFSAVSALSRGIHNISAWSDPSKSDLRMWQADCLNLYRFLLPSHLRESHLTLISICRLANMPAPSVLIKFERLRLLSQIACLGPLWGLAVKHVHTSDVLAFEPIQNGCVQCPQCGFKATDKRGLRTHLAIKHGRKIEARYFARGRQCEACMKLFAIEEQPCLSELHADSWRSHHPQRRMSGDKAGS